MKKEKRKNRIQWKKLRMRLLLLAVVVISVFRLPVVKGEAHSHSDECYAGSRHTHTDACPTENVSCTAGCSLHTHSYYCESTKTCYRGCSPHYHSGSSSSGGGCYGSSQYKLCSESYSYSGTTSYSGTCTLCGSPATITADIYFCSKCGKSTEANKHYDCSGTCNSFGGIGQNPSTHGYYEYSLDCGKIEGTYYDGDSVCWYCGGDGQTTYTNCGKNTTTYYLYGDACSTCNGTGQIEQIDCAYGEEKYYDVNGNEVGPICNQVVTELEPASKTQTITAGQTPNVSATATFLDEHTETVTCSCTGFNPDTYNTAQTVTLSYGNYHDTAKNPGPKNCTITVTVQGYINLSVSSAQPGMGTATGGGTKLTGSTVTVKASPVGSNRFAGWYENGNLISTQAVYTFTMPARAVSLTAHFLKIPHALNAVPERDMVYNGSEPSYVVTVKYSDGSSVALSPIQYTKTGFTKGTGVKTVSFFYTENGVTVTTSVSVTVFRNTRTCKYGHTYELSDDDTDEGCSKCAETLGSISAYPSEQTVSIGGTPSFLVTGTYLDGHSGTLYGWTTDFDGSSLGERYVTIRYAEFFCKALVKVTKTFTCGVCGTVYEANADFSNPGCPECRRTCVSITVSPANQMVEQGSPIRLMVTAKFRDGHTEEVNDWSSNYQPFTLGKQRVAVLYGRQTASVDVEVVAKKSVCINCGTVYDPMQGWCPNCGHILGGIRASTLDGSNLVITGNRPEFKVYGIYLDGHEERVTGGYTVTGLDIYTAGVQAVTVKCGGFSCTVTVTVVEGAGYNMCERGHVYQLNGDGSDPGCPYCSIDADDKTEKFYTTSYTDEIVGQIYREGVYYLKDGDAVTVTVTRQEKSGIARLFAWLFSRFGDSVSIKVGGIVGE